MTRSKRLLFHRHQRDCCHCKIDQFAFKLFFTAYGEQLTISVISVSSSSSCNFNGAISLSVTLKKRKKNKTIEQKAR